MAGGGMGPAGIKSTEMTNPSAGMSQPMPPGDTFQGGAESGLTLGQLVSGMGMQPPANPQQPMPSATLTQYSDMLRGQPQSAPTPQVQAQAPVSQAQAPAAQVQAPERFDLLSRFNQQNSPFGSGTSALDRIQNMRPSLGFMRQPQAATQQAVAQPSPVAQQVARQAPQLARPMAPSFSTPLISQSGGQGSGGAFNAMYAHGGITSLLRR